MFLKISVLFLVLLTSCRNVVESPVAKYNREFLKKNSMKIMKQRNKHMKIASENNIYYRDNKADLVDEEYYEPMRGTKLKREFRNKRITDEEEEQEKIKYLDSDISIYYRERTLKDPDTYYDEDNEEIVFLAENYGDYSEDIVSFSDVWPTSEELYGSLEFRKTKDYNYIDSDVMQENFDYIDIMNRVKNEIYLQQKEEQVAEERKSGGVINTVLDKFKQLFSK